MANFEGDPAWLPNFCLRKLIAFILLWVDDRLLDDLLGVTGESGVAGSSSLWTAFMTLLNICLPTSPFLGLSIFEALLTASDLPCTQYNEASLWDTGFQGKRKTERDGVFVATTSSWQIRGFDARNIMVSGVFKEYHG